MPLALAYEQRLLALQRWTPRRVTGTAQIQWWLNADHPDSLYQDAAMTTPAAADLDPVGGWRDRSGSARHATQATAAARPVLKLALQNGRRVVRFDGVDDFLSMTLPALTTQWIALAVASRSFAAAHAILGSATDNQLLRVLGTTGVSGDIRDDAALYQSWVNAAYTTAFHQIDFAVDGVNVTRHINGTLDGQSAFASTGITWSQLARRGVNDPAPIDLGEILIYSAIPTAAEQKMIRRYLRTRWGTP